MIFSVLALLSLLVSVCIRKRVYALIAQAFNCLFEATYDFFIGAYTGAFLSIINLTRTMIFIKRERFAKMLYIGVLLIFESITVVNCILTYQGLISLLPTIGSIIRTFCLWQTNMTLMRISGITTAIFYGLYYLYYQSSFMIIGEIILLFVSIYSIYIHDFKKERI